MKTLTGKVVSNKSNKTVIVLVETRMTHPIYKKQYTRSARIAAHDEDNLAQVGDKVTIVETRPISATKRFKLNQIVAKATIEHMEDAPMSDNENSKEKETPKPQRVSSSKSKVDAK